MSGPTLPLIDSSEDGTDRWLRQPGRVVALSNGTAEVAVDKAAACGGCATSSACGVKALIQMRSAQPDAPARVTLHPNALAREKRAQQAAGQSGAPVQISPPVQIGEPVTVAMPAEAFVQAAVLAFLLPPLALVLALGLSVWAELSLLSATLLCLSAFLLSFTPLIRAERRGRLVQGMRLERSPS